RTCDALAEHVRNDIDLVDRVIAACQAEAERLQAPDPEELTALRRDRDRLDKDIQFVMLNPGESEEDRRQATEVLKEQRCKRTQLQLSISQREEAQHRVVTVPTADGV